MVQTKFWLRLGFTPTIPETLPQKIMKKKNKVLLKVLVEVEQKKWVEKEAKKLGISEAEFVRSLLPNK